MLTPDLLGPKQAAGMSDQRVEEQSGSPNVRFFFFKPSKSFGDG